MSLKLMIRFLDCHQFPYANTTGSDAGLSSATEFVPDMPGRMVAKNVMLNIDGALAMALIPSNHDIRLEFLKDVMEAGTVRLAETHELCAAFPDCHPDAIPPFGILQSMRMFCSDALRRSSSMAFLAGSKSRMLEMQFSDYVRLVRPLVLPISAALDLKKHEQPANENWLTV